ncbi:hypothetical protein N9K61_01520 [Flavobacteriaceae bacterium]|jgi:hypothetical protein|nr:hypothetical protein [Flavobacteriaceae bacterium]
MKILKTILALFISLTVTAQAETVMNISYLDVPIQKIGRFMELHEQVTNMQLGDKRTLQGQWVMSHYYGSGPSIMVQDNFNNANDALNDDPWVHVREKWQASSEEERKEMGAIVSEYQSFWNGHTDEMRRIDWENNHVYSEEADFNSNFILVIGKYNTSGNQQEMGQAYHDWVTVPAVESGVALAGNFSFHLTGSGPDVMVANAYASMHEFATGLEGATSETSDARRKFWSLVEGDHEDQILIHQGHIIDGKFVRANSN